jgi:hypothetical protein
VVTGFVLAGLAFGLVVIVLRVLRARSAGSDVQRVSVEGPRPWAGPSRLNGSPSLRLPRRIPRPVEVMRREGGDGA